MTHRELVAMFRRERAKFAKHYPDVAIAGLCMDSRRCSPRSPCRVRDVAWCSLDTGIITLVDRVLGLPRANIVALIRHELGHLADPTPNKPGAEARADRIAYEVTGQRIRYDGHDLQTTSPKGRKTRPKHLHQ